MKTVFEMAREADLKHVELFGGKMFHNLWLPDLERFAAIVAAAERNSWPAEMEAMERQVNILTDALAEEREACAKVCDEADKDSDWPTAANCAAAIRARGQA